VIDPEIFSFAFCFQRKNFFYFSLEIWKHVWHPYKSAVSFIILHAIKHAFHKRYRVCTVTKLQEIIYRSCFDVITFMKFISVRDSSQVFSTPNIRSLFITYNCIIACCRLWFRVVFVRWWGTWIIHNGLIDDPVLLGYESSSVVNQFTTFRRKMLPSKHRELITH
jgi:hypothetical protein